MWSNEEELNFLEIYQTEPVLWEPTHPYHKDRKKVHDAWARISEKTDIGIEALKKKKNSLMATFKWHLREIKASSKSGAGAEEVHTPVWFAFNLMDSFLGRLYKCKDTLDTENTNDELSTSINSEGNDTSFKENIEPSSSDGAIGQKRPFKIPQTQRRRNNPIELQEAGKQMKDAMTTLNKVLQTKETPEDDCDWYAKLLGNKLRKLPELERVKLMLEIDGLYLKAIERMPKRTINTGFVSLLSPSRRSSSTCSTYSEPAVSQRIIGFNDPSSFSTPSPSVHNLDDIVGNNDIPESFKETPRNVIILSNEVGTPDQYEYNLVDKAYLDAIYRE